MIIGIQMHKALQVILRDRVLPEIKNIWDDLPITNDWEDVLDEGVTKGFVNWQLYGSCKPANQTYNITYHFELEYNDKNWDITECPLAKFSVEKTFLNCPHVIQSMCHFLLFKELPMNLRMPNSV